MKGDEEIKNLKNLPILSIESGYTRFDLSATIRGGPMKSVNPVSATGTVSSAQKTQLKPAKAPVPQTPRAKDTAFISEKAKDLEAQRTGKAMQEEMGESPTAEASEEPLKGTGTTKV
jgi:hypothetical protein